MLCTLCWGKLAVCTWTRSTRSQVRLFALLYPETNCSLWSPGVAAAVRTVSRWYLFNKEYLREQWRWVERRRRWHYGNFWRSTLYRDHHDRFLRLSVSDLRNVKKGGWVWRDGVHLRLFGLTLLFLRSFTHQPWSFIQRFLPEVCCFILAIVSLGGNWERTSVRCDGLISRTLVVVSSSLEARQSRRVSHNRSADSSESLKFFPSEFFSYPPWLRFKVRAELCGFSHRRRSSLDLGGRALRSKAVVPVI